MGRVLFISFRYAVTKVDLNHAPNARRAVPSILRCIFYVEQVQWVLQRRGCAAFNLCTRYRRRLHVDYCVAREVTREMRESFPVSQSAGQISTRSSMFAVSPSGNSATSISMRRVCL